METPVKEQIKKDRNTTKHDINNKLIKYFIYLSKYIKVLH